METGWPHPGTQKDWHHDRRYSGVLRNDMGDVFWTCDHFHKTQHEARDCAWEYRNSRTWEPLTGRRAARDDR